MFKPSQPMMARLRLTTKQVNGGYYKGNRTGSMGHFDSKRTCNYVIDWEKVRTYVVPEDLNEFKLTPFVTKRAETRPSKYTKQIEQNGKTYTVNDRLRGKHFLRLWADRNDEEVFQHASKEVEDEGVRDDHAQKIQGEAKKQ